MLWMPKHGWHPTEMENMSDAIAFCGLIYILGAGSKRAKAWRSASGERVSGSQ